MAMSDCLFCRMMAREIKPEVAYEDDQVLAIHDIHPQAPVHLLIIPKKHIERIDCLHESDKDLVGDMIFKAKQIAAQNGWKHYRLVFNNGTEAGQSIFHIHLHLLSGRRMIWPPG
ncbi:MAG: histidine triad nucleotide-binding protein [Candidatus Omnitrophica bacterium]|nr:histidine triad nucleotide-binding protein [Candidatus Omnitrophota bacterium]